MKLGTILLGSGVDLSSSKVRLRSELRHVLQGDRLDSGNVQADRETVVQVALHPTLPWVASVSQDWLATIHNYSMSAREHVFALDKSNGALNGLCFHLDSSASLLVLTCERGFWLYDYSSSVLQSFFTGALNSVKISSSALSLSPSLLGFGSSDGLVRVWSLQDNRVIAVLPRMHRRESITHVVSLSPLIELRDKKRALFVSGSQAGDLVVWQFSITTTFSGGSVSSGRLGVPLIDESGFADVDGSVRLSSMDGTDLPHAGGVGHISVYGDGKDGEGNRVMIVTTGVDCSVMLWRVNVLVHPRGEEKEKEIVSAQAVRQWSLSWEVQEPIPAVFRLPGHPCFPDSSFLLARENGELVVLCPSSVVHTFWSEIHPAGSRDLHQQDQLLAVDSILSLFDDTPSYGHASSIHRTEATTPPDSAETPHSPDSANLAESFSRLGHLSDELFEDSGRFTLVRNITQHPTRSDIFAVSTRFGVKVVAVPGPHQPTTSARLSLLKCGDLTVSVRDQRMIIRRIGEEQQQREHDLGPLNPWVDEPDVETLTKGILWPGPPSVHSISLKQGRLALVGVVWPKVSRYVVFQLQAYEFNGTTNFTRTTVDTAVGSLLCWAPQVRDQILGCQTSSIDAKGQETFQAEEENDDGLVHLQLFVAVPAKFASLSVQGKRTEKRKPSLTKPRSFIAGRRVASLISNTPLRRSSALSGTFAAVSSGLSRKNFELLEAINTSVVRELQHPPTLLLKEYVFSCDATPKNSSPMENQSASQGQFSQGGQFFTALGRLPDRIAVSGCEIEALQGDGPVLTISFGPTVFVPCQRQQTTGETTPAAEDLARMSSTFSTSSSSSTSSVSSPLQNESASVGGEDERSESDAHDEIAVAEGMSTEKRIGDSLCYTSMMHTPIGIGFSESQNMSLFFVWDPLSSNTEVVDESSGERMPIFRLRSVGEPFGHPSLLRWEVPLVPSKASVACAMFFNTEMSCDVVFLSLSTLCSPEIGRACLVRQGKTRISSCVLDSIWFHGTLFTLQLDGSVSCVFWDTKGTFKPFVMAEFDIASAAAEAKAKHQAHTDHASVHLRSRRKQSSSTIKAPIKFSKPFEPHERSSIRHVSIHWVARVPSTCTRLIRVKCGVIMLEDYCCSQSYFQVSVKDMPLIKFGMLMSAGFVDKAMRWCSSLPSSEHDGISQMLAERGYLERATSEKYLKGLTMKQLVKVCVEHSYFAGCCQLVTKHSPKELLLACASGGLSTSELAAQVGLLSTHGGWEARFIQAYMVGRRRINSIRQIALILAAHSGDESLGDSKTSSDAVYHVALLAKKCIDADLFSDALFVSHLLADPGNRESFLRASLDGECAFIEAALANKHKDLCENLLNQFLY